MPIYEDILALARSRPATALKRIQEILDLGEVRGVDLVRILQAGGIAARLSGDLQRSNGFLDRAIETAAAASDETGWTQANITQSGNMLLAGNPDAAITRLQSLGTPKDPELAARLDLQLGTIYARTSRFDDAVARFSSGLGHAEKAGDERLIAVITKNRGMLRTYSGDYEQATADLSAALEVFERLGIEIEVAYCSHNLGRIADYCGDLPRALESFTRAEEKIKELAGSQWEVQGARCDALLHAGLTEEAAELAQQICTQMDAADHELDRSEALLSWAKAEMARGDYRTAAHIARQAAESSDAQQRTDWAAHSRLVETQARQYLGKEPDVAELLRLSEALNESLAMGAIEAELAVAAAEIAHDAQAAITRLDAIGRRLTDAPLVIRLGYWATLARARIAAGNKTGADAAARSGYRLLFDYQHLLGAGDLRVAVRRHIGEIADVGMRLAVQSKNPRRVLRWLENGKWSLLPGIAQPLPDNLELRRALAAARASAAELAGGGRQDPSMLQIRRQAEARVRDLARLGSPDRSQQSALGPDQIVAAAGPRTIISIGRSDGRLMGVKTRRGKATLHDLGPADEARRTIDEARTALQRSAYGAPSRALPGLLDRLSTQLVSPFGNLEEEVIVLPPPWLFGAPWRAMRGLRERRVVITPSATAWSCRPDPRGIDRVLLVAGPDLVSGERELDRLQAIAAETVRLSGNRATVESVRSQLATVDVAHIAAHGSIRTDNPMFSSIRLADGPMTVYDIERIATPPHTVVLSACHVGLGDQAPGRELLGLVAGLLHAGTRTVVATTLPLPDTETTVGYMAAFHEALASGQAASVALQLADASLSGAEDRLLYRSAFAVFGGD